MFVKTRHQGDGSHLERPRLIEPYWKSPRAVTWLKINGPERNLSLTCNASYQTHIQISSQYLQAFGKKVWKTVILVQGP